MAYSASGLGDFRDFRAFAESVYFLHFFLLPAARRAEVKTGSYRTKPAQRQGRQDCFRAASARGEFRHQRKPDDSPHTRRFNGNRLFYFWNSSQHSLGNGYHCCRPHTRHRNGTRAPARNHLSFRHRRNGFRHRASGVGSASRRSH